MDYEIKDDETVFVSDDWYFTHPKHSKTIKDEKGRALNEIIIFAEPGVPKSDFEALAEEHNAKITAYHAHASTGDEYTFTFDKVFVFEELKKLAETFESLDIIDFTYITKGLLGRGIEVIHTPNDRRWDSWDESNPSGNNWGLEAVNSQSTWRYKDRMHPINVLVLDRGFYRNHEDLDFMYNFGDFGFDSEDTHGTHVAGVIGAGFDNKVGISGIAPNSFIYGVGVHHVSEDGEKIVLEEEKLLDAFRLAY